MSSKYLEILLNWFYFLNVFISESRIGIIREVLTKFHSHQNQPVGFKTLIRSRCKYKLARQNKLKLVSKLTLKYATGIDTTGNTKKLQEEDDFAFFMEQLNMLQTRTYRKHKINNTWEPAAPAATQKLLRGPRNTTWFSDAKNFYKNQKKLLSACCNQKILNWLKTILKA